MWIAVLALMDRLRQRAERRLLNAEQATGRRGEDLVHRYLQRQGYTVVARNFRPRSGMGELDLIAWDGEDLVIVEVKTRQSGEFGEPERNIGGRKEAASVRAAADYARRAGVPWEKVRFDVFGVVLERPIRIQHTKAAFQPPGTR